MAIINSKNESVTITVAFHVGRGGRFHNQGHKAFMPYVSKLSECFKETDMLINTDEHDAMLPDEQWELHSNGGIVLLQGREAIFSETGIIERDGEYDTDIVRNIEDCDDEEIELIYKEYCNETSSLSEELKDYVCHYMLKKRIVGINFYKTNADIFLSDGGSLSYNWDCVTDVEEDDISEWLEENDIDPVSIDKYADDFVSHFYNN